eukprot:COSAG01_NODE_1230_length_11112_cov_6.312511_5_plen_200_part_00
MTYLMSVSLCAPDWNCGSISRNQLLVDCKTLVRQPSHPAPPMDPGPKVSFETAGIACYCRKGTHSLDTMAFGQNLLEYLGLDWEMRSRMLSQKCAAWDVIRESEPEVQPSPPRVCLTRLFRVLLTCSCAGMLRRSAGRMERLKQSSICNSVARIDLRHVWQSSTHVQTVLSRSQLPRKLPHNQWISSPNRGTEDGLEIR